MILTNVIISKKTLSSILLCLLLLFGLNYLRANDIRSNHQSKIKELDVETGVVFSGYNDVKIPKSTGTRISLSQQLTINPSEFFRARFNFTINNKHTLSAFIAPLKLKASGSVNFPVRFQDTLFPAGVPLNAVYRFNSYRLTYRYNFSPIN
ncbi:MAG: hypothetical protein ABIK61_01230 [candidate division WOR-3 bacterium]